MKTVIREMRESDRAEVHEMMRTFYASDAVYTNGSDEIFKNDIDNCINDCPYLEGYVFEAEGDILGYGMTAKSFSTEFGKPCVWIEDIYIKEKHRGLGIGGDFLKHISTKHKDSVIRLEVEKENERAVYVYEKGGFEPLPYLEMIKK